MLAATLVALVAAPSSALAGAGARRLSYHGFALTVPAGWPVYQLDRRPQTCVRFNRHAVYLGSPSTRQRCPAHAAGRTEAVLIRPLLAGQAAGAPGPVLPAAGTVASFAVPRAGVVVTATWSRGARVMSRILHRRLRGTGLAAAGPTPQPRTAVAPSARIARQSRATTYSGKGFDACSTPSTRTMNAWRASPYRALGVYIGGVNSACSQPNLTASWVRTEVAAGWHLIPTYVGLQAGGACGCASISASSAASEGAAAASDAVNRAQALGIGAGNPIYDDMEGYARTSSNSNAVLAFLQGWTTRLHALGYLSGVYSSGASGIADLVQSYGTGYVEPDDIWIADWNGQASTNDPYVPSSDWTGGRRIHQYTGGHDETYGGVTINIDGDYVNGATAGTGSPFPDGTFIEASGDPNVYRVAGGAPLWVSNWAAFGGPQPVQSITAAQLSSLPAYPANGTFLTTTTGLIYRVAGGAPFPVSSWSSYGGQQTSVTVDEWDLQNVGNPLSHLSPTPADGTVVEGLPSGTYWSFTGGKRSQIAATVGAIGVEDQALGAFAVAATTGGVGPPKAPSPRCVIPQLRRLTLLRARTALRRAHCRLGHVHRPRHWLHHHVLRVYHQSARAKSKHRTGFKVDLKLL